MSERLALVALGSQFSGGNQQCVIQLLTDRRETIAESECTQVRQHIQYPVIFLHERRPKVVNEELTQP